MILAVDFDDTIHDTKNREPGYIMGKPLEGAKETIDWVYANGGEIIVFCVWADNLKGRVAIARWMEHFKIPYKEITALKPPAADHFIDNRNLPVPFTNWRDIKLILERVYGFTGRSDRQNHQSIRRPHTW